MNFREFLALKAPLDAPPLQVEAGEHIVLSPDAARFKENYHSVHPTSASEAREIVGLSPEITKTLREQGRCCQSFEKSFAVIPIENLESRDGEIRQHAWTTAFTALNSYIYGINPEGLLQMEPLIARYLQLTEAVLNVVVLPDIIIADGGKSTVSSDTHLVLANKVNLNKTGQLICSGLTKFKIMSLEGTL